MSEKTNNLHDPYLVAIWPGMGSVALVAGQFLLQQLKARPVGELEAKGTFEIQSIDVSNGISTISRLPRNMFFEWKDPREQHDLLIFVGETQPPYGQIAQRGTLPLESYHITRIRRFPWKLLRFFGRGQLKPESRQISSYLRHGPTPICYH